MFFVALGFVDDVTANFFERTLFGLLLVVVLMTLDIHSIVVGNEIFQFDAHEARLLSRFVDR